MAGNLKPYFSAALIAVGAVAVLALYTGDSWLAPIIPLIVGAAAILPLSVVGALLLHPEVRSAPSRVSAIAPLVVVGAALGVGLPALWAVPKARTAALSGPDSVVNALAALEDPDKGVRMQACRTLFVGDMPSKQISDALLERPRLAAQCLSSLGEGVDGTMVAGDLERRGPRPMSARRGAQRASGRRGLQAGPAVGLRAELELLPKTDLLRRGTLQVGG